MASTVGDLCMAECKIENGQKVVIVAVYISPNKTLDDITDFFPSFIIIVYLSLIHI